MFEITFLGTEGKLRMRAYSIGIHGDVVCCLKFNN